MVRGISLHKLWMVEKEKTSTACKLRMSAILKTQILFLGRIAKKVHRPVGSATNSSGAVSFPINIFCRKTYSAELTLLFVRAVNETI